MDYDGGGGKLRFELSVRVDFYMRMMKPYNNNNNKTFFSRSQLLLLLLLSYVVEFNSSLFYKYINK